jgi:polysaccharide export outer membrane protein
VLAASSWAATEEPAPRSLPASDTSEVRIELPAGAPPDVAVIFAEGGLQIDLPRGAAVPFDLERAGAGLLRGGQLTTISESRVRLSLSMVSGTLDEIRYEAGAVVFKFARRHAVVSTEDEAKAYKLGVDDKIQVSVDGQPEMQRQLNVGPNGTIAAPLLGEIPAAGLTVDQLASAITERLARDFLVDPRVNVEVVEYKSQWVLVTGSVHTPGRVPLRGGTDLKEAISAAGGLTPEAGEEIAVSRKVAGSNEPTVVRVVRSQFERGESNPPLANGDIINVAKAEYCYVQGEVRANVRIPIEKGLTLLRAITLGGGFTEWANTKNVQILPQGSDRPSKTYNVKDIQRLKIPDPELHAGDVIIVKRRVL